MDQWLGRATMHSGGGGLASTAMDVWRFAQMMLNRGEFGGVRILAPRTIALMVTDQIGGIANREPPVSGYGYGFAVQKEAGQAFPEGSYWWYGGLGTDFWIDPETDLVAVFMTQTYPTALFTERERLAALVYGAVL
jgi:CubicO group peptidase (beta-lactamase class C family)